MEFYNHFLQIGHLGRKNVLVAYMGWIMKMQSLWGKFIMVKIQMPFLGLKQIAAYQMPQSDDSMERIQVRKLHMVSSELAFNFWLGCTF